MPDFIQTIVRAGNVPLTFSDPARYPRASRILAVVEDADKSSARQAAIGQLEREGWTVSR